MKIACMQPHEFRSGTFVDDTQRVTLAHFERGNVLVPVRLAGPKRHGPFISNPSSNFAQVCVSVHSRKRRASSPANLVRLFKSSLRAALISSADIVARLPLNSCLS